MQITATQVIFDLIQVYGFDTFEIDQAKAKPVTLENDTTKQISEDESSPIVNVKQETYALLNENANETTNASSIILNALMMLLDGEVCQSTNRPFSYSTKEPGSSDIFVYFCLRGWIPNSSTTVVRIRKFHKMYQNILRFTFFFRIAKRSIGFLFIVNKCIASKSLSPVYMRKTPHLPDPGLLIGKVNFSHYL